MPVWRMQCEWSLDTLFPRDRLVITPHFNDDGLTTDPQGLCEDLVAFLSGWDNTTTEIRVTAYDAQGTPPVFPQGTAIAHEGVLQESGMPRELAVCLSYYSEQNVPRKRGRLYIPATILNVSLGRFVSAGALTSLGTLAQGLADLGGVDVDWVVYSRVDDEARPVSNWWVDNEWDVIRSRGLRAETRTTGTVGEG